MKPEGCNRSQKERVQTFGYTFLYRYVSILFPHPALTPETFIVRKSVDTFALQITKPDEAE